MIMNDSIRRMLNPKTIAVIGANEKGSYGGRMMRNLLAKNYQGEIYPVNPGHDEIYGLKCYPAVDAIPCKIDLAVIIVKAELVEGVVKTCAECDTGGCLIISAGFRELDSVNGPERERRLAAISKETGMRIIGPNCLGIANSALNMWACALVTLPKENIIPGRAALISQSGAAGFGPLLNMSLDRNVGLRYIATTGNETDVDMCDFLEYMLDDDDIKAVGLLIEGLKESGRFSALAAKAAKTGKKIVALKIGESEVGSRAAASHTASMTGDMAAYNALIKQYGVIKAEDYDELIELLNIVQQDHELEGKRLAVFAHSGGISGLAGDLLCKYGFEIPVMSQKTQDVANVFLKGFGSPRNPMDMTSHMRRPCIKDIVGAISKNEDIDGYVFATNGDAQGMKNVIEAGRATGKACFYIWTGRINDQDGLNALKEARVPISFGIQRLAVMLKKVIEVKRNIEIVIPNASQRLNEVDSGYLNEAEAKQILKANGIPIPEAVILSDAQKDGELQGISFDNHEEYAAKIISREILHKTDIGGVILGIKDINSLMNAVSSIRVVGENCKQCMEGVMVEKMCRKGTDMVVGIRKDPLYGHILMVGLGGIYTELFHMISIRILPLSKEEIYRMLEEIPGFEKMAAGYRGQPKLDKDALADAILCMTELVWTNKDRIKLLEVNPLRVMPEGVCALDCVMEVE